MKKCNVCNKTKAANKFNKNSKSKDGLSDRCKSCSKIAYADFIDRKPFYSLWQNIKQRTGNPNRYEYATWGGKGIKNKLGQSYAEFEANVKPFYIAARIKYGSIVELCIDRINSNGHYELGNIRFVTRLESNMNRTFTGKRTLRLIELNGNQYSVGQLAKTYDLPAWLIRRRLNSGWNVERALNEPRNKK